ncbi:MAG: hypothetical protein LBP59_20110, partial [Planctomycetaceae bacterium]|nr:hypothetical protein [Planctomycetaceae bacterium]
KAYGNQKGIGLPDNFVTKILILDNGDYLIGSYGGGIVKPIKPYKLVDRKPLKTRFNKDKSFFVAQNKFPKLPSKIKPPTAEELRATFYKLKKTYQKPNHSNILALNDDWRTQGDWIDHYGRHSAVLCAQAGGGLDFFGGYFSHELESRGWIGRNCLHKGDQLRRWVHWIESNDRRVLQCLQLGGRKQAEWDDHKEAYPMNLDGPHIYGTFKIPQGKYILSLYFFNKDGHGGKNRLRDFVVSVKTMKLQKQIFESLGNKNIYAEAEFFNSQNGVNSRVNNFWGGLYKRFFIEVKKDEYITVCVNSNYSFNTIMSGVFFDPAGEMKSLTSLNSPYPPPRQLTKWEEVIESPIEKIWWGLHVLDYLLYLRDSRPTWFYPNSRKSLLPLIRVFIKIEGNKPCSPAEIDAKDKNLIRSDIAKLLNYTQMFYYRDMVDFSGHKQATYWWHERTRIGRSNALNFMWNEMDYMKFWRGKNHDLIW